MKETLAILGISDKSKIGNWRQSGQNIPWWSAIVDNYNPLICGNFGQNEEFCSDQSLNTGHLAIWAISTGFAQPLCFLDSSHPKLRQR